jgi:lipopolysaccharide transport system permease protein
VLQRSDGPRPINVHELWEYRSLIAALTARQLQVRYAQTVLGVGWAVVRPLVSMLVFTIIFQRVVQVPSDNRPYQAFSLAAVVPWSYFSTVLTGAGDSLTGSSSMLTKVYFPRLALPISAAAAALVDFAIGFALLLVTIAWFGIVPSIWSVIVIPVLTLAMMLTAIGVGCAVAALDIQYRDVKQLVPFVLQIWMYASPVIYPLSSVPERYKALYQLNPMAPLIGGFRSVLLQTGPSDWHSIGVACLVSLSIGLSGMFYFRFRERIFADVV